MRASPAVLLLALIAIFAPRLMDRELRDSIGARFTTGALSGVALLAAFVMLTPTYTNAHAAAFITGIAIA